MPASDQKVDGRDLQDRGEAQGPNIDVRLDSFVDEATIRRVKGVIRELYAEKGYNDARVDTELTPLPDGPEARGADVQHHQGPKVQIREVVFDGNKAFSDGKLRGQMKENKAKSWLSFITERRHLPGSQVRRRRRRRHRVLQQQRLRARAGRAAADRDHRRLEGRQDALDSAAHSRRRGQRYAIGKFDDRRRHVDQARVPAAAVQDQGRRRTTAARSSARASRRRRRSTARSATGRWCPTPHAVPARLSSRDDRQPRAGRRQTPPPIMDVTIRMNEGKQFFVNRITFLGNTTTHDNVIRREMRVWEGGVFNTEALKDSIRRLNQLGYFKPLEGKESEMDVEADAGHRQQGRHQAEVRGAEPQPALVRRRRLAVRRLLRPAVVPDVELPRPRRDRRRLAAEGFAGAPVSGVVQRAVPVRSADHRRRRRLHARSTSSRSSTRRRRPARNLVFGLPLADYTRLFTGYSYERNQRLRHRTRLSRPRRRPTAARSCANRCCSTRAARRTVSKISPSVVFNTVNQPIFPTDGKRLTASVDLAGLGGNTSLLPDAHSKGSGTSRSRPGMSFGLRAEAQYIRPYGQTTTLPIFEKFFLGGEYSIRGFDIRSVGPRDPIDGRRHRRQQDDAVQRRVLPERRRAGPAARRSTTPVRSATSARGSAGGRT